MVPPIFIASEESWPSTNAPFTARLLKGRIEEVHVRQIQATGLAHVVTHALGVHQAWCHGTGIIDRVGSWDP